MPEKNLKALTLGVISDIHHWYDHDGRLCSFGPYVREIDIWSRIFGNTIVTAGKGRGPMPNHSLPYEDQSIEFIPLYHIPGSSWTNRLKRILHIPLIMLSVIKVIRRSDIIHLRTPSFSCLIAMVLLLFSRKPRIAKWATLFEPFEGLQFTSRLQRLFLKAGWLKGPVMVYGEHREPYLVSFFPAAMTTTEFETLLSHSHEKSFFPPWQILMVGRMVEPKGFDLGLKALAHLKKIHPEIHWQAVLVGEGSYLETLRDLSRELGISENVEFPGGKTFEQVLDYYATAHVLLMPGQKEGFAKVLIEACASNTVPVSTDTGLSPWILGYGQRGLLSKPDAVSLADVLSKALIMSSDERKAMISAGQEWVNALSLEKFEEKLSATLYTLV
jgi:glycosyltransferase involved in cell wall biosynthesis